MAASGVEPYVLSTKATRDADVGPVKVRALPSATSVVDYAQNLNLLWKGRSVIPLANVWHTRALYRSMAIERFAAELVEAEEIDVIHSHFGWPGSFGGVLARRQLLLPVALPRPVCYSARIVASKSLLPVGEPKEGLTGRAIRPVTKPRRKPSSKEPL
jgi:hypothetical protein